MDHAALESRYHNCYKFLDGVDIPASLMMGTCCDLSFNDGITAGYLLSRREFSGIYLPFLLKHGVPGLLPLDMTGGLYNGLSSITCDYVISAGGTFNFISPDDIGQGVYNSLRVGGMFLFGVYPQIYDENGRDMLEICGREMKINIGKRLTRLANTMYNAFLSRFSECSQSVLVTDASAGEIKAFFRTHFLYEYRTDGEFETFFSKLNESSRYYMFWRIINGTKI